MKDGRITGDQILARLEDRVIIMDGAMGTMLRKLGWPGNPCEANLADPELVAQIHRSYIKAGAELIGTNTFSLPSNAYELSRRGAEIAHKVAEESEPRAIVAGSIAATSRNTSDYTQIAEGLLDGGVDVLLLESIYDLAKAEAALKEIRKVIGKRTGEIPVMVSVTIDREGKILSGEDFRTVFGRLEKYGLFSLGFNCSMGAGMMIPLAIELSEFAEEYPVSLCPSAGLPDRNGQYPEGPEFWASCIGKMRRPDGTQAFSFAGGCCGTTPEYIKALKDSFKQYKCSH